MNTILKKESRAAVGLKSTKIKGLNKWKKNVVIYLIVAQSHMHRTANETRTHKKWFARLTQGTLYPW